MKVLVDTHTFVWALLKDHRLSTVAKRTFTSDIDELVFSLVSLWEIAIKMKIGKFNDLGSSVAYIRDEMNEYGMELLPIRYQHIIQPENASVQTRLQAFIHYSAGCATNVATRVAVFSESPVRR